MVIAIAYVSAFILWVIEGNVILETFRHGEITIKYSTKAIIVRDAYVIRNQREGVRQYVYDDGVRVKKDSELIYIYPLASLELLQRYIARKDETFELKKTLVSSFIGTDSEIQGLKTERDRMMLRVYDNGFKPSETGVINTKLKDLNNLIVDRIYANSEQNHDVTLMENELAEIYNELMKNIFVVKAPESGIFTSQTDGYEVSSSREYLSVINKDMVNDVIRNPIGDKYNDSNIGKILLSNTYYFVLIIPEQIRSSIGEGNYIRIMHPEIPEPYYAVRHRLTEQDDGSWVLILRTDRYMELLANKRIVSLDMLISSVNGIKIPLSALISKVQETKKAQIYVSKDGSITRIEVDILAEDDKYAIIYSGEIGTYDLVVTNPEKAREGMFIN